MDDTQADWALAEARAGLGGLLMASDRWLNHPHHAGYAAYKPVQLAEATVSVSSSSQPSLMAEMLQALEITGPERVLEIGTGTGYHAALLCEGLDADDQVVSIDIAADLVEAAAQRLAGLGYRPRLASVDGAAGYPEGAPYDRIIATCSLPEVPTPWLTQVRAGGVILVNLYRALGGGALARLRVQDGQASGHFMPYFGGFMPTRTYRRVSALELLDAHRTRSGAERPATIDMSALKDDAFGMLAALRVDMACVGSPTPGRVTCHPQTAGWRPPASVVGGGQRCARAAVVCVI